MKIKSKPFFVSVAVALATIVGAVVIGTFRPESNTRYQDVVLENSSIRIVGRSGVRLNDMLILGNHAKRESAVYIDQSNNIDARNITLDKIERAFLVYVTRYADVYDIEFNGVVVGEQWNRHRNKDECFLFHGIGLGPIKPIRNIKVYNTHILGPWDGSPFVFWNASFDGVRLTDCISRATDPIDINVNPGRYVKNFKVSGGDFLNKEVMIVVRKGVYNDSALQGIHLPPGWIYTLKYVHGNEWRQKIGPFATEEAVEAAMIRLGTGKTWPIPAAEPEKMIESYNPRPPATSTLKD